MNKNFLINDGFFRIVEFVSINKKGEKVISKKNLYCLELVKKSLSLQKIGCNFVVDTEYRDNSIRLNTLAKCGNAKFEKKGNSIDIENDLVNILNMVNLFLEDRQLLARHNNNNNVIIQVVDTSATLKDKDRFIRSKESTITTVITTYDLVTGHEVEENEKVRKGVRFLNDDDIKQILKNLKECDSVKDSKGNPLNITSLFKKLPSEKETKTPKAANA